MTVQVAPHILSPELILVKEGTSPVQYLYNPITLPLDGADSRVYLGQASTAAVISWGHAFQKSGPFKVESPTPYTNWVTSSAIGIARASVYMQGSALQPSYDWKTYGAPSSFTPHVDTAFGMSGRYSSSVLAPTHDTTRRLGLSVTNGGYADLTLLTQQDSASRTASRATLIGISAETAITLHYDFLAPTQTDRNQQLYVHAPGGLSTSQSVGVGFFPWNEPTSHVTYYSLTLCPMKLGTTPLTEQRGADSNNKPYCMQAALSENAVPHQATASVSPPSVSQVLLATDDTLWSFVLTVKDAAGNIGTARRLALVNKNSRVDIDTRHKILVTTAGDNGRPSAGAQEVWQTSTNSRYQATWENVFSDPRNERWLKPTTRNGVPGLTAGYDHVSDGSSRTGAIHLAGTPNRLGVTRFETGLTCISCSNEGDPTFTLVPGSELNADTLPPLTVGIDQHLVNGHWYQFHVRATNVFGAQNTAQSEPFGIDVTPPEIEGLVMMRDGRELVVHNLNNLQTMDLSFRTFDTESGLRQIQWSLHGHRQLAPGVPEEDAVLGGASIAVKPVDDCENYAEEACLCDGFVGKFCYLRDYTFPLASHLALADSEADRHGRQFTFYLTVTNRAGLQTTTSHTVLVDVTPPDARGAAVLEGPVDEDAEAHLAAGAQRDVDYTADAGVVVRFSGFVDRESGIDEYAWTVGTTCVRENELLADDDAALAMFNRRTPGARGWDTYTAPAPGRYVVSAFAINGALERSAIVCSDGLTYDVAPPEIGTVRVNHLTAVSGRVRFTNGELWVVHTDLTRSPVTGASAACVASAAAPFADAAEWALYPEVAPVGGAVQPVAAVIACDLPPFVSQLYLAAADSVNVSWVVSSGLDAMQGMAVALASAPDALQGDFASFRTVGAARPFVLLSDASLENGNVFFVLLRLTKKSKVTASFAFGPMLVATHPPRLPTGLPVPVGSTGMLEVDIHGLALRARWPALKGEGVRYTMGVGRAAGGASLDDLVSLVPLSAAQADAACTEEFSIDSALPENAPCAAVPLLQLGGSGDYVVVVRACTITNACVALLSMPQPAVAQGPPQAGLVHDVGDGTGLADGNDAAAQATLDSVRFQWRHFDADGSTVRYEVGVGSGPGKSDVASLRPVDGMPLRAGWYEASVNAQLSPGVRYYATVRASNSIGSVTVSSDGIVPLPPGALQVVFDDGTRNCLTTEPNLVAETPAVHLELAATRMASSLNVDAGVQPGQRYIWRLRVAQEQSESAAGVLELWAGTAHVLMPLGQGAVPARCCCSVAANGSLDTSCPAAAQFGFQVDDTCACPRVAEGEDSVETGSVVTDAWSTSSPLELPFRATGVRATIAGRFWPGNSASRAAGLSLVVERLVHCDGSGGAVPLAADGADATAGAVHAWWHWPTAAADSATLALRSHVTHFEWALQLRNGTHETPTWLLDFTNAGWAWEARTAGALPLPAGIAAATAEAAAADELPGPALYIAVRACHAAGCWAAGFSPPRPLTTRFPQPTQDSVSLAYTQDMPPGNTTDVEIQFSPLAHAVPVVLYQWALEHGGVGGAQLVPWQTVPSYSLAAAEAAGGLVGDVAVVLHRTLPLDLSLYDGAPTFVRLRAFGADGAVGEGVARVRAATALPPQYHVAVLDVDAAVATALLASTPRGTPTAAEVTARAAAAGVADLAMTRAADGTLASAWPDLWPTYPADYYSWSVGTVRDYVNCSRAGVGAAVLACGQTNARAAVARDVRAVEGRTYYFCIQAGPQTQVNARSAVEGAQEGAARPLVAACSNGVTVDRTPPLVGVVAIGHAHADHVGPFGALASALHFQRETHSAFIRWHGFSDAEALASEAAAAEHAVPYDSGVANYTVRLGTAAGQADIFGPVVVGEGTTHVHVTNLSLPSGRMLVATVDAEDFVGLQTRAVSGLVLVDATPPLFQPGAHVQVVQRPAAADATDLDASRARSVVLEVSWVGFDDAESGVAACSWAVGRVPHSADLAPFQDAGRATFVSRAVRLAEGRAFAVTVRCINRAGLWAEAVADGLVAATAAPAGGLVWDGTITGLDADFQTATDVLAANWAGFVDAAAGGGVAHYAWAIGTHPGLTDLVGFRDVGLATSARAEGLRLRSGAMYYFAVRACGASGLCTVRVSDGIMPDDSPPIAGRVIDGAHTWDVDVQAYGGAVTASWAGFHDAHSSIARYTWCVGLAPGDCDLLEATDVGLDTRATTLAVALPAQVSVRAYVTVTAYNGAGLTVTASSDGVALDLQPPHVVVAPQFEPVGAQPDATLSPLEHDHQISRSVLRGSWSFADVSGRALSYWYTVDTHHEGVAVVRDAPALEDGFILAGLQLSDGDTYYLSVTACDEAERCITVAAKRPITIDVSPPSPGRLVDAMAWTPSSVRLAWADFVDPHSGVARYEVTVGTTPAAADVVTRQVLTGGDGPGSATLSTTRSLAAGELLFITLAAVNPLGLASQPLHGEARAMASAGSGGVLQLIFHQCESTFCDEQCTCGPYGRCPRNPYSNDGVNEIACTKLAALASVVVNDGFVVGSDADAQVEVNVLAASWTGVAAGKRLQYTAGAAGRAPGAGIFGAADVERFTWLEASPGSIRAVLPLPDGTTLSNGVRYVFYIRVWTDMASYREYVSDGVVIDTVLPLAAGVPRQVAVEPTATPDGVLPADVTNARDIASGSSNELGIDWAGVFRDVGTGLSHYEWALGRRPGSSDLHSLVRVGADVTRVQATGLALVHGEESFATVRAVDKGGLSIWRSSLRLVTDLTPPEAGVVVDGLGPRDEAAQGNAKQLSAHWHGFYDAESGVVAYEVAFGRAGAVGEPDVVPWTAVGLNKSATFAVALQDGERYAAHVRAYNSLGRPSATVQSDGIVVDLSPPAGLTPCIVAPDVHNVIQDGIFAHDPENIWATAFAGTACVSSAEEKEDARVTTLRLRHAASLAALPPVAATAASAQLVCSNVPVENEANAHSNVTEEVSQPGNHTFSCSTTPALPEDGGRPPVAFRCTLSHATNGTAAVVCAWDGDVAAVSTEIEATGAVLDVPDGTVQCAFSNVTTGAFACVELGGDRARATVSLVGFECQVEHELSTVSPTTQAPTTVMSNTTAMLNATVLSNTTAMPSSNTTATANITLMANTTTAMPETTAVPPSTTIAHPLHDRITCSLRRHVTAVPQGVAVLLHPLSPSVTDDLGNTPPFEATHLLGAYVSCATTSARLQGTVRGRLYRAGAAADASAVAVSQVAECPAAEPGQPLPHVRLDWSIEGASPSPLVAQGEVLEVRLEVLQGAVALTALKADSGGCDAVSAVDARSWLLPDGTWVTEANSDYGGVSPPVVQALLARVSMTAWASEGGSRVAVADVSAAEYSYRLPPQAVLTQTVTTEPQQRYRLHFILAVEAGYPGARQGLRVTIAEDGDGALPLLVRTYEARHVGLRVSETWTKHVLGFEAKHAATRIAFTALPWGGEATPLLVAQPTLVACGTSSSAQADSDATVLDVGAAVQGASDAIVASWRLADGQSTLDDAMWAIGTSPGGAQLQDFAPAPHMGTATAYGLSLPHNGTVYVTLAARNAAGHVGRFESAAVHIDLTPPAITALEQPLAVIAEGTVVDVAWVAADGESEVVWCQVGLALASSATRDALVKFGAVNANRSLVRDGAWRATVPVSALPSLAHGEQVVAAVRCGNAAGLLAEAVSERGTICLTQPPSTTKAWLRIARPTGPAVAPFAAVSGAQAETAGLVAFWSGFAAETETGDGDAHVASYEARLLGPGQPEARINVGRVREVHFGELALQSGSLYTVEVRARDIAGALSAAVIAQVRVLTTAPVATNSSLCATWPEGGSIAGVLLLGWRNAFAAAPCPAGTEVAALGLDPATCLRFEVSVGRYRAGGDIVRQVETVHSELAVPAARLLRIHDLTAVDETVTYMVAVTAINAAGVGTTRHFEVHGATGALAC